MRFICIVAMFSFPAEQIIAVGQESSVWTKVANGELAILPTEKQTNDSPSDRINLLVHFHGQREVVLKNAISAKVQGALLVVNFKGLSEAYRQPYLDSQLLARQLTEVETVMRDRHVIAARGSIDSVSLSSFSAGYGAVREILKSERYIEIVKGILLADSIYAGFEGEPSLRSVDQQQMASFVNFARLAVNGRRKMIVTCSQLETPNYASTAETANYLISSLKLKTSQHAPIGDVNGSSPNELKLLHKHETGNLQILSYSGADGPAHLEHLKQIGKWLPLLK